MVYLYFSIFTVWKRSDSYRSPQGAKGKKESGGKRGVDKVFAKHYLGTRVHKMDADLGGVHRRAVLTT